MSGLQSVPTAKVTVAGSDVAPQNVLDVVIHLGCTKETSSFEVVVNNSNPNYYEGQYSPGGAKEFTLASSITVKLKRGTITGSTKALITGKIENIEYADEAEEYGFRNVVYIRGRCLGQDLFARKFNGDLIAAAGSGKAETIVDYLIDNYTSLSHTRNGTNLIEESNTTFVEFLCSYETIFDILKYIADVTSTSEGVIGYDLVVEYDGKFAFRPRNEYEEPYTLEEELQLERYAIDMARVKNKIWVFGKADKPYPIDVDGQNYSDQWTENHDSTVVNLVLDAAASQKKVEIGEGAAALYGIDSGDHLWLIDADSRGEECVVDTVTVKGGENDVLTMVDNLSYSYQVADFAIIFSLENGKNWGYRPGTQWNELGVVLNNSVVDTGSWAILLDCLVALSSISARFVLRGGEEINTNDYSRMLFKVYFDTAKPDGMRVYLYSGDCQAGSFAYSNLLSSFEADKWSAQTLECGSKSASNWTVGSTFDWSDVKMVEFIFTYASPGSYHIRLDRFHFCGKRWGGGSDNAAVDGFAEDAGAGSSQALYGIKEYVLIEDNLLSDVECEAKAQAILSFLKDPNETMSLETKSLDPVDNAITSGNIVDVNFAPLSKTGSYRIDSADIRLSASDHTLSYIFNLENAPVRLADYLYYLSKELRTVNRDYSNVR